MSSQAVLVTGGLTGIGRAAAPRLAVRSHTVHATARRTEAIADLEARGCRTLARRHRRGPRQAAVDRVVAEEGAVGALVNAATA